MPTVPSIAEPVWGSPSLEALYNDSVFSDWFLDPDNVMALLVRYLQYVFSDSKRIVKARAKNLIFSENDRLTKIKIQSGIYDKDSLAGAVPGIYLTRKLTKDTAASIDPDICTVQINGEGEPKWSTLWEHGVLIRCESKKPDEADLICQEVAIHLSVFAPLLKQDARLSSLRLTEVSGADKPESGTFSAKMMVTWVKFSQYTLPEQIPW